MERNAKVPEPAFQPGPAVPAIPVIGPLEKYEGFPYTLVDGLALTIGWHWRLQKKGGPAFVIVKRTAVGTLKVTDHFPLTEVGWAQAWRAFISQNPSAAEKVLARLKERERELELDQRSGRPELAELDARTLVRLPQVALLGGYAPGARITTGQHYDARFLQDRLALYAPDDWNVLAEAPYAEIEDVEIGGPGLVKTGGGFTGSGSGAVGALEGAAVAAVLNALTTRTTITTVVRVQAANCELFLLWTKATPEQLRIELSHPLGAIRAIRTAAAHTPSGPASPVAELSKLAGMLQAGLLTREEFEQLKANFLHG